MKLLIVKQILLVSSLGNILGTVCMLMLGCKGLKVPFIHVSPRPSLTSIFCVIQQLDQRIKEV